MPKRLAGDLSPGFSWVKAMLVVKKLRARLLAGIHMSVGLSNISIMLPRDASDGSPLKPQIESAFLTLAVPRGLDTVLASADRDYRILPADNLVMRGVREAIALDGIDTVLRIQQIYRAN